MDGGCLELMDNKRDREQHLVERLLTGKTEAAARNLSPTPSRPNHTTTVAQSHNRLGLFLLSKMA